MLSRMGIPTIVAVTRSFLELAQIQAKGLSAPEPRLVVLDHPIAGLKPDEISERTARALDGLKERLRQEPSVVKSSKVKDSLTFRIVEGDAPAEPDAFLEYALETGISDALPAVPPTPDRVARMLSTFDGSPQTSLGLMPPRYGAVTVEAVAICAVMAGCKPEYFSTVLGILRAVLEPEFNLNAIQTTTNPSTPLAVVSGPIVDRLGMNCESDVFGPGNRPNTTIGRAIRLCLRIVGGCFGGEGDMATLGHPGKYSYVIAENVPRSPWGSLAASRGCPDGTDSVTVFGAAAPHNINDHESDSGHGILRMVAGSMRNTGLNNNYYDSEVLVIFSPEHAETVARDGYTRRDVQEYLFQHARTPLSWYSDENVRNRLKRNWPKDYAQHDPASTVPIVRDPKNILIAVIGGPGKHSALVPTIGVNHAVTRPLSAYA